MPNIPPLISHTPNAQPLYVPNETQAVSYPSGISTGASWSAGPAGSGTFFTIIPVPGAASSTIFTVQANSFAAQMTDALASWVVTAFGSTLGGGSLYVYVAALPLSSSFRISWAVVDWNIT